ncbi:hypothetical protein M3P05_06295 [Sansalvadorimonas sp. 2012CJ34-2]|uniref:Basal-body rod modification protein FlgD n=1 Tax=Parendozoicomonas callyspongiae TaxID=2942213 RepID=A0ABT0PDX1_9GAMM|nr:flagellar hook capping FlgD N-terminal domain-containing protein [Sansalvadorimonas sp. 2012CJ34-2]MCL6269550.1 hypothetical protein [Sansalvadorimonas sp. 2012CJ34-2]
MLAGSVSPSTANPAEMSVTGTAPDKGRVASELSSRQTFMKLLVAQLKNQDPMNPMESTDMVNQLAAISSVEHLESIRSQLSSLNQGQSTTNAAFASDLIGKTVGLDSDIFALTGPASGLSVDFRIPQQGAVKLTLLDELGRPVAENIKRGRPGEVQTSSLASLFGQSLSKGSYRLLSEDVSGEPTLSRLQARVESVMLPEGGQEPRLVLRDSVPVPLSQVRTVR